MKNKTAAFFSVDALIAITIILIAVLLIYPAMNYKKDTSGIQYDIIKTLSSMKIGEVNSSLVSALIAQGKITDPSKSVLEQIGDFYTSDIDNAKLLAQDMLSSLNNNTNENLGIWYGSDLLASINSTPIEHAKNVLAARQEISGIQKGTPSTGFVSKAWLKKITSKKTTMVVRGDLMCGDWKSYGSSNYCGYSYAAANYRFTVGQNATINKALWLVEPAWQGEIMTLYINGHFILYGAIPYYRIFDITPWIVNGENIAKISGLQGVEDGASHIAIEYETPDLQTYGIKNRFDFNELYVDKAPLYQEKSILATNPISSLNVALNTTSQASLYLKKNEQIIFIGTKPSVNNNVFFSNSEISSALLSSGISYSNLGNEYFYVIVQLAPGGTSNQAALGTNSYVYINYSSQMQIPFGSIDITNEIPVSGVSNWWVNTYYRNLAWQFSLPNSSIPISADWQLSWISNYAGIQSEQYINANDISLYSSPPQTFIQSLSRYGYTPLKAPGVFRDGTNNFTLNFGSGYAVSNEASYGTVTYFIKSFVNYGETKPKAKGGTRLVQFEDGTNRTITIGDPTDPWDPQNDSIDDAVERLLSQLDANGNGKIDLTLNQDDFEINSLDVSGVPYLWSTEVQVRKWE
jgi:hypothetical protein